VLTESQKINARADIADVTDKLYALSRLLISEKKTISREAKIELIEMCMDIEQYVDRITGTARRW